MKTNKTTTTTVVDKRGINAYTDKRSAGVVLFKDDDINLITKNSGKHAASNEYQVHYWFLNGRFTLPDGSIFDIAVPTVYFNYKQEVSSASVDFHLSDVDTMSTALEPVHNSKANEILKSEFAEQISTLVDAEFEWKNINLGTIHRHPNGVKRFSPTDLDTKVSSPGICFPLAEIEEGYFKPSFSSILLHTDGRTVVCHTEYRLANKEEDDVNYYKGRAHTIVDGGQSKPSDVESLIGIRPIEYSYTVSDDMQANTITSACEKLFKELDFNASTEFVKEANVEETILVTYGYNYKKNKAIPDYWTAEYKKVAAKIKEDYDIDMYQRWELNKLSAALQLAKLNDIEDAYLGQPGVIENVHSTTTITEILDYQDRLWLETKAEMNKKVITKTTPAVITLQAKKNALIACGAISAEIDKYTIDEINEFYNIIQNDDAA